MKTTTTLLTLITAILLTSCGGGTIDDIRREYVSDSLYQEIIDYTEGSQPNQDNEHIYTENAEYGSDNGIVYVRGLGDYNPDDLEKISKYIEDFYHYKVVIGQPADVSYDMYSNDGKSLDVTSCIYNLKTTGMKTVFVTNENVVSGDMEVRGGTFIRCNTVIVESTKYNKDTVLHELGHTLGLEHCENKNCLMGTFNNSYNPTDFCENCKRKLKK